MLNLVKLPLQPSWGNPVFVFVVSGKLASVAEHYRWEVLI